MTDMDLRLSPSSETVPPITWGGRARRVARAALAILLGLLAPGLGQVYQRRSQRGLVFCILVLAVPLVAGELHLLLNFYLMIGSFLFAIIMRLRVAGDGAHLAWVARASDASTRKEPRALTAIAAVAIVLLAAFPTPEFWLNRWTYFRAYRSASESMCPTICADDRLVANMDAYRTKAPQRGDVVILAHPEFKERLIKRVVAVGGDIISPGPKNEILVNGNPLKLPTPCSKAHGDSNTEPGPEFKPVVVPVGSYYVVGDNLGNSYDSRFWGPVAGDQIKGRAAFIYWSWTLSQIGCKVR